MKLKFSLPWNVGFRQSLASFLHRGFLSPQTRLIWLTAQGASSHGRNLVIHLLNSYKNLSILENVIQFIDLDVQLLKPVSNNILK